MPATRRLAGVYVPVVTPFASTGGVDIASLDVLTADCLAAGATGIVALSTTGESSALDAAERHAVVDACARVCDDWGADLIVGAGTNDTRTTIARHQELAGVRGVVASLVVVPYYVRPSEPAIVAHFRAVAAASPVPVIVYNVPYRTGRGLGAASLLELAHVGNVVGVKQAVGGIDADTLTLLAECPEDFAVLGGDDAYLFPTCLMGGAGAIAASAQIRTERFVAMIDCALRGSVEEGRKISESLLALTLALFAEPSPAVIKGVLHAEGRIPTPDVRMPLANATKEAVDAALGTLP